MFKLVCFLGNSVCLCVLKKCFISNWAYILNTLYCIVFLVFGVDVEATEFLYKIIEMCRLLIFTVWCGKRPIVCSSKCVQYQVEIVKGFHFCFLSSLISSLVLPYFPSTLFSFIWIRFVFLFLSLLLLVCLFFSSSFVKV